MYVLGLLRPFFFCLFNAYLVVFGLFLPKTEEKNKKKYLQKIIKKNIIKNQIEDKGGRDSMVERQLQEGDS